MNTSASSQLESIQEMMASGHRSVHMERHTLWLWGVAAALLILLVDEIFTQTRFPEVATRSLYAHAFFIVPVLLFVGVLDFHMTRAARRKRDESISFVQMQVTKIWWMLIGLIVLINMGMNFFGGGFLFYGVMLAVMGIAFFVHGLFSQQMLSWIGCMMILLGLSMVLFQVPYALQEWIAIGVFGLGLPVLAMLLDKEVMHTNTGKRLLVTVLWLVAVLLPAHIAFNVQTTQADPGLPVMSLQSYMQQDNVSAETQVVRIPKGTKIPLQLEFAGNVLQSQKGTVLSLTLMQPVELAIKDGKLDGRFKIGDMHWADKLFGVMARANSITASVTPGQGPRIEMKAKMEIKE